MPMVESHWLLWQRRAWILALMSSFGDGFDVVDYLGFEEEQFSGAVGDARLGEEVGVTGGDDAFDHELAGPAVVRVQAVLLPRIVTQDHVGTDGANDRAHLLPAERVGFELAVDRVEEVHLARTERVRGGALLVVTRGHQRSEVLAGIPGALRAVGEHEELDVRSRACPFCEGGAAAELDVVGMGADREDPGGQLGVGRGHDAAGASDRPNSARSSGTSTSKARSRSRTTRSPRPRRRASAAWRRNDPGP